MNKLLIIFFLTLILVSCEEKFKKTATVKLIEKEFNFGKISLNDTIIHTFEIQNVSKIPFKVKQIGTSCGCTTSNFTKEEVNLNEFAIIEASFIPNKDKIGKVKESIVIDCNVEQGFITFYLTGEIEE